MERPAAPGDKRLRPLVGGSQNATYQFHFRVTLGTYTFFNAA